MVDERDLPGKTPLSPGEVWAEDPGVKLFPHIIEVGGIDTSDPKEAEKVVDNFLANDPAIKETAESKGHDILKRITPRGAWIFFGAGIAFIAAGIGAKVWYDHSKKKKESKE